MVAMESESSCGPHPKDHPPPPTAQEPNPTVVILSPLEPSGRVGKAMLFSFSNFLQRRKSPYRTKRENVHTRFESLRFGPVWRIQTPRDVLCFNGPRDRGAPRRHIAVIVLVNRKTCIALVRRQRGRQRKC